MRRKRGGVVLRADVFELARARAEALGKPLARYVSELILAELAAAGVTAPSLKPLARIPVTCSRCGDLGHNARSCRGRALARFEIVERNRAA